ncbi:heme-binding protein [Pseudomonas sp. PD9R]|jgi:glc operon protein GlcG|uniref:GlcG/HbpS family heme-binding protein n=1 Tax=Pseudomonas sp. PD9R TaxID=2853534 RepID=UPI001C49138E|nr:heme-binding protein [Pseudomonas sp. PD9R]MBV6823601.1 heme-binding protein [Pseudomonas sp. PD9R]
MKTKRVLELDDAELMLVASLEKATRESWKVSMAVVDEAGCLMTFRKLDGASVSSVQTAIEKARSAAVTRRPTKFFEDMVTEGRSGASMIHGVFPIEGGLPIVVDGEVVGGFAVSGLMSQLDIVLVEVGLQALAAHQER